MRGVQGPMSMPLYGIGTWQYNDSVAEFTVETAFAMGYRHVDTALVYGNQVGVGKALQKAGLKREDYFVTSKIPGGLDAKGTVDALEQCLSQLGVPYVDLMLIHFPADWSGKGGPALRVAEWKALEQWAKSGKARAIGVSHYCRRQIQDIQAVATVPIAVNQVEYHVGMGSSGPKANDDRDWVRSQGILYQSFSPLCGPCPPPDNKELLTGALVTDIGKAHNKSGAQVALRWLVQQGIPVIPKSNVAEHIKSNMEIFDFNLTADEMARLTAAPHPAAAGGPSPDDSGDCGIALELQV